MPRLIILTILQLVLIAKCSILWDEEDLSDFTGLNSMDVPPLETYNCLPGRYGPNCESVNDLADTPNRRILEAKPKKFTSCADHQLLGKRKKNGIYYIWPNSNVIKKRIPVYCDFNTDGGGWTVIQRRGDYGLNYMDFFYSKWNTYTQGFGSLRHDFYLGNNYIYALTLERNQTLRIEFINWENRMQYAHYERFWIDDEFDAFRLHVEGHNGTAADCLSGDSGSKFVTGDMTWDELFENYQCVHKSKNAWWHNTNCSTSNLNGFYPTIIDDFKTFPGATDVFISWCGCDEKDYLKCMLKFSEMKVRPITFKP